MSVEDNNLRAWWAVKTMSEKMDLDLSKMLRRGEMGAEQISDLVQCCESCPEPGKCKSYLLHQNEQSADIMESCLNRVVFESLAKK